MNATEVRDRLATLGLPAGKYAVHASAALVLRGIVPDAHDIDVVARGAAWEHALTLGTLSTGKEDAVVLVGDDVEVWAGWYGAGVDGLIDGAELVGGVPCVSVEEVRAFKERLGRPKDGPHLEAIARYLREERG